MITITIKTGNDAFDDGCSGYFETARILRNLAQKLENGNCPSALMDINGNCVGTVKVL